MGHFPFNPYCPWCVEANMNQRSFSRKGDREDDGLKAITEPNQMYSTDHLVIAKSKEGSESKNRSASGDICAHTI
eukprot:12342656-Karenia_brevis.AAC.1